MAAANSDHFEAGVSDDEHEEDFHIASAQQNFGGQHPGEMDSDEEYAEEMREQMRESDRRN